MATFKRLTEWPAIDGEVRRFFTTSSGMAGYFAVEMWINDEDEFELSPFWEPWQTGFGRYPTEAGAQLEAWELASIEDLPYYLPGFISPFDEDFTREEAP